jgi:hypothetical protein
MQAAARAALARVAEATEATIRPMVAGIPAAWEVEPQVRDAWVRLLVQRAAFLQSYLFDAIFPQGNLPLT